MITVSQSLAEYFEYANMVACIKWFLLSGSIFVAGAIGFDLFEGRHSELFGSNSLLYAFYYTWEEVFEMLGVALFIYALLTYIVSQFTSLAVVLGGKKSGDKP